MAEKLLDLEARWPELFEPLTDRQRRAVVQALAANWHEGWKPNYDDVRDLVELQRGVITHEEYMQRAFRRLGVTSASLAG